MSSQCEEPLVRPLQLVAHLTITPQLSHFTTKAGFNKQELAHNPLANAMVMLVKQASLPFGLFSKVQAWPGLLQLGRRELGIVRASSTLREQDGRRTRRIAPDVTKLVGKTPLVYLNRVVEGCKATIAVKMESMQPCGNVKDRVGFSMVEDAEAKGVIQPGKTTFVEPTLGNMGIGLAFVAAAKGYKLICTMPSYASLERRMVMLALGAELVLMAPEKSVGGAVEKAKEIVAGDLNAFMLQQFNNPANVKVHFQTTGPEIWEDTAEEVDASIAGIGSGGIVTGVGRFLMSQNPNIKIESDAAVEMARKLAVQEGLLVGISSGANVEAAIRLAKRPEFNGKLIVTMLPSTGERYLSGPLFEEVQKIATDMKVTN